MKKRILSMLLALTMIVGMLPMGVLTATAATLPNIENIHMGDITNGEKPRTIYWDAVSGAAGYTVDVVFPNGKSEAYTTSAPEKKLDNGSVTYGSTGTYTISVRAYGASTTDFLTERTTITYEMTNVINWGYDDITGVRLEAGKSFEVDLINDVSGLYGYIVDKTYTVIAKNLPSWMSMDSKGVISGTAPNEILEGERFAIYFATGTDSRSFNVYYDVLINDGMDHNEYIINKLYFYTPDECEHLYYGKVGYTDSYIGPSFMRGYPELTQYDYYQGGVGEGSYDCRGNTESKLVEGVYRSFCLWNPSTGKYEHVNYDQTIGVGHYIMDLIVRTKNEFEFGVNAYISEDLEIYVDDNKISASDIGVRGYDSDFAVDFVPYDYYIYDVKPEINSVTVNGTSVADGATYVSNSKSVTVKTTYDSELSQALQDYGCSVKQLSAYYLNGEKINVAALTPVSNGNGTSTKTYSRTLNGGDVLKVESWLEVTWPDGSKDVVDERTTNVTYDGVKNVSVSATFSGTPANATSNTNGVKVTNTKWYKWVESGSTAGYVEMSASDTIKEGYTYRCEVTVGATGTYALADGYTVKINGIAATKKSGNTWYRDVTITGYTSYVDVYDIALPEAGAHPDFTFNDEDCYHSSVALVEWFECDKDGKKLSGALSADYKFKEDSYYRLEVTAVPDTNYLFDTRNLDFFIGSKAVQYYYPYQDTTYPNSVTGWKVYHVDDANGTYTVQIGDITLKDGDYLANNATAVTTSKPVGGYACYKDGVLTLNNFVSKNLIRYYERYLEVELIGENKIGAIADYYYWDGNASNDYYTAVEFCGDGNLEFDEYYDKPYSNISVNGDVFFNGNGNIILDAEIHCFQFTDNVIINDGYVSCYCAQSNVFSGNANITVNGGKLQMTDGGSWYGSFISEDSPIIYAGNVYVSADPHKIELADCVPWDGVTNLNTYDCVWIVDEQATVTHTVTFKVGTTTVDTKTVEDGKTVTAPADPTQSGKTFLGWYTDGGTKFDFTTPITGDITLTAKFEDATSTVLKGDVNLDGVVDMKDAAALQRHVLKMTEITDANALAVAELTGDGIIDMKDAAKLTQYAIKMIDSLD